MAENIGRLPHSHTQATPVTRTDADYREAEDYPETVDDNRRSVSGTRTAERVVYYITGILLSLMAFRFVLSLLGANRGNGFADFIYGVTYPFVVPFFGLFGYRVQYGVSRFEIETLVAMAVYGLVAYGIVQLIRIASREPNA